MIISVNPDKPRTDIRVPSDYGNLVSWTQRVDKVVLETKAQDERYYPRKMTPNEAKIFLIARGKRKW